MGVMDVVRRLGIVVGASIGFVVFFIAILWFDDWLWRSRLANSRVRCVLNGLLMVLCVGLVLWGVLELGHWVATGRWLLK